LYILPLPITNRPRKSYNRFKNLYFNTNAEKKIFRAPPCFGRHVSRWSRLHFAVVSTQQLALGSHGGLWVVAETDIPPHPHFTKMTAMRNTADVNDEVVSPFRLITV
jgi:hypothetical protein